MHERAIRELKKDWEAHNASAARGDARGAHAAREAIERLAELGVGSEWLDWARKSSGAPAPMASPPRGDFSIHPDSKERR